MSGRGGKKRSEKGLEMPEMVKKQQMGMEL
jgi:hypothetical protein